MRGDAKKSTPKGRRLSDLQTTGRITGRNGINVIRDDEEISSDDENLNAPSEDEEEDPYANETADEKRVRLAKQYLAGLEGDADGDDSDDPDHAAIAHRLKKDALELTGKLRLHAAAQVKQQAERLQRGEIKRAHHLSVTCVALCDEREQAWSGSKDGTIVQWDIATGGKTKFRRKLRGEALSPVLSLAASSDGKFVAASGDSKVRIFDTRSNSEVKVFTKHQKDVTALCFRLDSHQLFTGSHDRTIKIFDLDEMGYVETLFGHQAGILALDSLRRERVISAGGADRTCRVWKIIEESHLVFRGHESSIDCISLLTEDSFVSGSQDGSVALWSTMKKKPVKAIKHAHGGNWITSVAAHKFSDLAATGSSDGLLRLWHASERDMVQIASVDVPGYVNALAIPRSAKYIVAGTGQEHRLGRWNPIKEGHNGVAIIPLPVTDVGL